jgi:RHS repeat-associated protein
VTQVAHRKSDASVLETFGYTYDAVGNPTVLAEANGDRVTWTYDALSQLIGDVRGGASSYAHTYTYDAVGNRAARGTTDYTYDAANQLTLRDADGALTTYSYDANGNLLAQQKPYAGTTTFTWGYENELLTSLEPDGDLVTMTYDGDLQRRQRVAGATEINFVWDREQVLMELNAAGATAARYTLAPLGYGDLVSQRRWGVSSFYHFDALGTTRRVTAADESTQLTYVRDAFGVGIASTGTTTNRFRYLGKLGYVQEDTLAGALLRRRYYQYEIGRFVSRDPVRDPGRSEYGYVLNAPTRAVDPGGAIPRRPWDDPPPGSLPPDTPGWLAVLLLAARAGSQRALAALVYAWVRTIVCGVFADVLPHFCASPGEREQPHPPHEHEQPQPRGHPDNPPPGQSPYESIPLRPSQPPGGRRGEGCPDPAPPCPSPQPPSPGEWV